MIRSLYVKFALYTVIIMFVSSLIAFYGVNTFYHQFIKERNDEKNMAILNDIVTYGEEVEDLTTFLQTVANVGYKMMLVHSTGKVEIFGEPFREQSLDEAVVKRVLNGKEYHGMRDFPKETFVTGFFADEVTNSVGMPLTFEEETYALFMRPNIKQLFSEVHFLLGGLLAGMIIISLIAMLWMARKLIQPLTALTEATKQISNEQFTIDVPDERRDEIGQLARSFSTMAHKLAKSNEMRKQFTNDITHDLQTPLQNIKGYTELLADERLAKEEKETYLKVIKKETNRLSQLSNQLLLLSTLETVGDESEWTFVRIDVQLKETLNRFRWLMEEKEITVQSSLEKATVYASKHYLENVWDNLIANALKYNKKRGEVSVACAKQNNDVIVTIRDSGVGIPKDKLPHIFDRFYRIDQARTSDVSGTGLGLAIVQRIVSLHNGKVTVASEEGVGTTFTITLPHKR